MHPDPPSRKQHVALILRLKEAGYGDRAVRLAYCSGVCYRRITSTNDLSATEAGQVLSALELLGPPPAAEPADLEDVHVEELEAPVRTMPAGVNAHTCPFTKPRARELCAASCTWNGCTGKT